MKTGHIYILSTILLAIFIVPTSHAQSTLSMGLTYAKPAQDLATADYRDGYGFYMEVMSSGIQTRLPIDLQFGGRLNLNVHGEERVETNLLAPFAGPGEYSLSNQSAGLSGVVRLITPAHHRVRFYTDGFVGSSVFYTTESLGPTTDHPDYALFEEEDCNGEIVQNSWAFHYGLTGGLMIQITHMARLDLRTTYTRGGNIDFVELGSVHQVEQNAFNYTSDRTALDMLQIQVGVNFDID